MNMVHKGANFLCRLPCPWWKLHVCAQLQQEESQREILKVGELQLEGSAMNSKNVRQSADKEVYRPKEMKDAGCVARGTVVQRNAGMW